MLSKIFHNQVPFYKKEIRLFLITSYYLHYNSVITLGMKKVEKHNHYGYAEIIHY